ncbi:MAG: BolA/IbaG family iron-sulfur metabolism protein [Neptuniibacter sp.]
MIDPKAIEERLLGEFPGAELDISGEDCNFSVSIISEAFEGKSLLDRQKRVLKLFEAELKSGILHALSVKAFTMEQYLAKQNTHLVQLDG